MNSSCTLIILLRIRDWRKTQRSLTRRFWMYLSLMDSHVWIQFEMYKCTNSVGSSTVVVNLKENVGRWEKDFVKSTFFSSLPVDYFHGVKTHIHVYQHGEVISDLRRAHKTNEDIIGNNGVEFYQFRILSWSDT